MNYFKAINAAFIVAVSGYLLVGCTGGGGSDSGQAAEILEGTVTSQGVYFAPTLPDSGEVPLANETIVVSTEDGTQSVVTDQSGKFKMQLRKRDGSCNVEGAGMGSGKGKKYGGNGRHGNGQKIRWNYVDNDGDGVCDNTLEVSLN